MIVRNINGILLDENYRQIPYEIAKRKITERDEVICKPSQESGSGRGILFLNNSNVDRISFF